MVRRRQFSLRAAGAAAGFVLAGVSGRVGAQAGGPVEGRDFTQLARPVAVNADGKIHVSEFFWYGCPHCAIFEPNLDYWASQLPADVAFSRVPVAFNARAQVHQRIYYTWEALGVVQAMHMKTFLRFNVHRKPVDNLDDLLAFAQESGLDAAKVRAAWNSFSVQTRCQEAIRLTQEYDIAQTPEMAIQGRFTAAGPPAKLLATTDWLVKRLRQGS
jgi:protein dithiol oxidoreductase (disulfide-forming)